MEKYNMLSEEVMDYYEINQDTFCNYIFVETIFDFIKLFLNKYTLRPVLFNNKMAKEGRKRRNNYVFRGVSACSQKYSKITTSLYAGENELLPFDDQNFANAFNKELMYVRRFQQNTPKSASDYSSTLDLVAMGQHNSLKTRLIDWTRSPLIATLFALHSSPEIKKAAIQKNRDKTAGRAPKKWCGYYMVLAANSKDNILVQGLPTSKGLSISSQNYIVYGDMLFRLMENYNAAKGNEMNKEVIEMYFVDLLEDVNTEYFLKEKVSLVSYSSQGTIDYLVKSFINDKLFFLETNFSNSRITDQRGLFQIAVNPYRNYIDATFKYVDAIFISDKARSDIITYCEALGMNYYGLMQDYQSIAEEINRR